MAEVNIQEEFDKYRKILNSGCIDEIKRAKYNLLWESSNFIDLIVNYITLDERGVKYDFGKDIIPKGTKLYRIRDYKTDTDFSDPSQWKAPPHKPQNRANGKGQEALYLGSTETICLLETHIKKDDTYALGIYEVVEDIKVGGYLSHDPQNKLHNWAGIVLNAFLIAPSRNNDRNKELFDYLDSYYGILTLNDFTNINELEENDGLKLPMKFGVFNQREQYYNITNQLCNILSKDTADGIRYSSCYLPLETVGINCSDFNIVLYREGISKVKFINHIIKTSIHSYDYTDFLKIILNSSEEKPGDPIITNK
ncbi:RES family NAD+ phosphorylase [Hungatella effluvii]|uniref:RES family NAD+ phosphorylase n=1 Tax=Hungatella effluvii TaxID=1096246 RepID=UPI0022E6A92B|nr:RES family NAD+ phosphorylase [Hungatella effluvii]